MSGDLVHVELVDGVVEDVDQADADTCDVDTLAMVGGLGNALSAASYGAMDLGSRLLKILEWSKNTHKPRALNDPRCAVCYTAGGQPEPWPCTVSRTVSELGGVKNPDRKAEATLLAAGAECNRARADKGSKLDDLMLTLARLFGERPARWPSSSTADRVMADRDLLAKARRQLEAVRPGLVERVREVLADSARRGTGVRR